MSITLFAWKAGEVWSGGGGTEGPHHTQTTCSLSLCCLLCKMGLISPALGRHSDRSKQRSVCSEPGVYKGLKAHWRLGVIVTMATDVPVTWGPRGLRDQAVGGDLREQVLPAEAEEPAHSAPQPSSAWLIRLQAFCSNRDFDKGRTSRDGHGKGKGTQRLFLMRRLEE